MTNALVSLPQVVTLGRSVGIDIGIPTGTDREILLSLRNAFARDQSIYCEFVEGNEVALVARFSGLPPYQKEYATLLISVIIREGEPFILLQCYAAESEDWYTPLFLRHYKHTLRLRSL